MTYRIAETFFRNLFVAPEERRWHIRRGWKMLTDRFEHLSDESLRSQLTINILPPGLQTLINSAATFSGCGANIAPRIVATTSKDSFGYGRHSASPSSNFASNPSLLARARATAIQFVAISIPVTLRPDLEAGIDICPAPQATSSKLCPSDMPHPFSISKAPGSI